MKSTRRTFIKSIGAVFGGLLMPLKPSRAAPAVKAAPAMRMEPGQIWEVGLDESLTPMELRFDDWNKELLTLICNGVKLPATIIRAGGQS